jgi:hypothetical protein
VHGDRDRQGLRGGEVPADDADPDRVARLGEPATQLAHPAHRRVRRQAEGHDERDRLRPHGRDVGEVLHGGAPADVGGGAPVAAEVMPLDEHVGADDEPRVRRGDDGAVVARSDDRAPSGGQRGQQHGEDAVLADLADGRPGRGVAGGSRAPGRRG